MAEYAESAQSTDFKDTKVRLVVLGVLQIIFGGFCALIAPLMMLGMIASAAAGQDAAEKVNVRMMIPGMLLYLLMAVWFIWMGIGSIMTRRWARALILIASWFWLIGGTGAFVFMLKFLPNIYEQMGQSGKISENAAVIMKFVMLAFMAVIYVIIPALFVLCYKGRNVKATCEYRDPHVRWTDKCPLPVLAMSMVCVFWAVSLLFLWGQRWTLPFFGTIISGVPGAIVALFWILVLAYITWGMYKLDIKAWWCVLLVNIFWLLSTIITFSRVSMLDFYEKMNLPKQQMEMMKQYSTASGSIMIWLFIFWFIVVLAYLLYIRRYFVVLPGKAILHKTLFSLNKFPGL